MLKVEHCEKFSNEGYFVVKNVLSVDDIQSLLSEMNNEVMTPLSNELFNIGQISNKHENLLLEKRIQLISCESGKSFPQHFDFSLPQSGVTLNTPLYLGNQLFDTLRQKKLVDIVSEILQTNEISSNPVQHLRIKLPQQLTEKISQNTGFSGMVNPVPWHQDAGVILPESDDSHIITCWVALTDVSLNSGCMQVIPGSHKDIVYQHCHTQQGLAIPDSIVNTLICHCGSAEETTNERTIISSAFCDVCGRSKPTPLPMSAGSVLFMDQKTVHSSLENTTTDTVRISMDLRYQPTGTKSGRPVFDSAGFVVRSHAFEESELKDFTVWKQNWLQLREKLSNQGDLDPRLFNRWDVNGPNCAQI